MKLSLSSVTLYFGAISLSHSEQVRKGGLPPLTRFTGIQTLPGMLEFWRAGVNRPSLLVLLFGDFLFFGFLYIRATPAMQLL